MFAADYFGPRYFAPRYFGKVGAELPIIPVLSNRSGSGRAKLRGSSRDRGIAGSSKMQSISGASRKPGIS